MGGLTEVDEVKDPDELGVPIGVTKEFPAETLGGEDGVDEDEDVDESVDPLNMNCGWLIPRKPSSRSQTEILMVST